MFGAFEAPPFRFAVDDGYTAVELEGGVDVVVEDLDRRLVATTPPLAGAPVASWIFARLGALVGPEDAVRRLALSSDTVEHVDDGVFVVDFVVTRDDEPIAKLQVQGGTIGAGALGVARSESIATDVVAALEAALAREPEEVAICRIRVLDPAVDEKPREYGYDGHGYLGA